jgi:hypothetical protein
MKGGIDLFRALSNTWALDPQIFSAFSMHLTLSAGAQSAPGLHSKAWQFLQKTVRRCLDICYTAGRWHALHRAPSRGSCWPGLP